MKKIIFVMMVMMMAIACGTTKNVQDEKADRANYKHAAKVAKQMTKQGWEPISKTQSLNTLIYKHISALENGGENTSEFIGFARSNSKSAARHVSTFDAAIDYANQSMERLRGKMASDLNYAEGLDSEFNKLYVAYTADLSKRIDGELKRSFTIIRNVNGIYEVESYFIVNEEAASKARVDAMRRAIKETKIAQEYAQQVIDFVEKNADPTIVEE